MNNTQRRIFKEIYGKICKDKSLEIHKDRKNKGLITYTAPIGYKWVRIGSNRRGHSELIIDEQKKNIVIDIFTLYITGAHSYITLAEEIEKKHKIKIHKSRIGTILNNKFYNGFIEDNVPHIYPRIISKELFNKAQLVLAEKKKTPKGKFKGKPYIFRGLMQCSLCECTITCEKHKNIVYYHCTQSRGRHKAPWLNEITIIAEVERIIKKIKQDDPNFIKKIGFKSVTWDRNQLVTVRTELNKIFKRLYIDANGNITYALWTLEDIKKPALEKLKEIQKPLLDKESQLITIACLQAKTIDEISLETKLSLSVVQDKLIDLQLMGIVDEDFGNWKIK